VVENIRERLEVNKQESHKFHVERFNFKKLNKVEGKEIQVYLTSDHSGQQTVIPTTIWWWQKLGRE
jgi:hypothetical protein